MTIVAKIISRKQLLSILYVTMKVEGLSQNKQTNKIFYLLRPGLNHSFPLTFKTAERFWSTDKDDDKKQKVKILRRQLPSRRGNDRKTPKGIRGLHILPLWWPLDFIHLVICRLAVVWVGDTEQGRGKQNTDKTGGKEGRWDLLWWSII